MVDTRSDKAYFDALSAWRASLDEGLRRENSWLALAGLIWLEKPQMSFGGGSGQDILLKGVVPNAGQFLLDDEGVRLVVGPESDVLVDGQRRARTLLRTDRSGQPHRIEVGSYAMMLIERGGKIGIRLWDNTRPERESFQGRVWFPPDLTYRVIGKLTRHTHEEKILIQNELGETEEEPTPGYLSFELKGKSLRLEALEGPEEGFFLIFKDGSSGDTTYGSGRFLVTSAPDGDDVEIDFNRAYNPPCAFTEYATCPLPPKENLLPIEINAGEMKPVIRAG